MELGATVCTPADPACPACPVASRCEAQRLGLQTELPEGRTQRRPACVTIRAALIRSTDRVLLVRRPEGRVLSRFWEIPQTGLDTEDEQDLRRALAERHGLDVSVGPLLAVVRHAITFRRIRVEVYATDLARTPRLDAERLRWAAPDDLSSLALSSMTRKILDAGQRRQMPLALG
jgi:A/G-specific adenine glycosylase